MSQSPQPIVPTHGTMHRVLIGLDPALERLGDLLRDTRRGRVNTVVIKGESGMGEDLTDLGVPHPRAQRRTSSQDSAGPG